MEGISFPRLPTLARKIGNHNTAPYVLSHLIGLFFYNTGILLAARKTIFLPQSVQYKGKILFPETIRSILIKPAINPAFLYL